MSRRIYSRRHLQGSLGRLQHDTEHVLSVGDNLFLLRAMQYFGIPVVGVEWSTSKARHPDIWIIFNGTPTIWVTREWRRQHFHERRKRLTHEILHILGEQHGRKAGGLVYSTYPRFDTYSRAIYEVIK